MRISDWSSDVCSSDLIGVANKANGVPRRPTGREISDRIAAEVETVGDDLADFRRAILKRTESAKPFGAHQNPVRIGDDLHIAAHGLIGNQIERVLIPHTLARKAHKSVESGTNVAQH